MAQSRHFIIYADAQPDAVKDRAARFERFDRAIRVALKLPDPDLGPSARTTVFVVPSLDDVRRLTGARDVSGLYRSQSPAGPVAFFPLRSPNDQTRRTPSPLAVLQRNYARQVILSTWGESRMPAWLNAGLAEFFATARARDDGGIILGAIPEYRWDGVDLANVFPIDRLVRGGPDYGDSQQAHVYAGRSWLLIHYMIFDTARAKQLDAYIAAVKSGRSAAEATAILDTGAGLDIKLNTYGARPTWATAALGPGQLPVGDVSLRALTAGETAMLPVLMRVRGAMTPAMAADIAGQARSLAAPFPDDPSAQNALAAAEYDAGNDAAAAAAADRALAADPTSVDAMIQKGRAMTAIAAKTGKRDPAAWAAARRWFLAANKAESSYFYPVQLFYESFAAANEPATPSAQKAMLYAYALNPASVSIRWQAAGILLRDGAIQRASVALDATAFDEVGGRLASLATAVLAALDAGSPATALGVFDRGIP